MAVKYTNFSVLANIDKFLTPQPSLDVRVFDDNMQMHPHIRKKLWQKAEFVIKMYNNYFPMVEIDDVILGGSLAGYMWHDKSDFDIKIVVKVDTENYFIKTEEEILKLLFLCSSFVQNKYQKKIVIDKLVDFEITNKFPRKIYGVGHYSLKQDCWLVKPLKDLTANLNPQKLYNVTMKRILALNKMLYIDTKRINGRISKEQLDLLFKTRVKILKNQFSGAFEYLIYKLIIKEKATLKVLRFYNKELAKNLSVEIDDL